jgi:hypothetical protein
MIENFRDVDVFVSTFALMTLVELHKLAVFYNFNFFFCISMDDRAVWNKENVKHLCRFLPAIYPYGTLIK